MSSYLPMSLGSEDDEDPPRSIEATRGAHMTISAITSLMFLVALRFFYSPQWVVHCLFGFRQATTRRPTHFQESSRNEEFVTNPPNRAQIWVVTDPDMCRSDADETDEELLDEEEICTCGGSGCDVGTSSAGLHGGRAVSEEVDSSARTNGGNAVDEDSHGRGAMDEDRMNLGRDGVTVDMESRNGIASVNESTGSPPLASGETEEMAVDESTRTNGVAELEKSARIQMIRADPNLTTEEKAKKMQQVYSESYWKLVKSARGSSDEQVNGSNGEDMPKALAEALSYLKTPRQRPDGKLGCKHYQRGAMLVPKCCNSGHGDPVYYMCRFCHDEHEDHPIDRLATEEVVCLHCGERQPLGKSCTNCGVEFASYFCEKCRLYDDSNRQIYHCDDCGICRVGSAKLKTHCHICRACITTASFHKHKCREGATEANCPICTEYLFTSTEKVLFLRCGHSIHKTCLMEHLKRSYKCPLCLKSVTNMEKSYRQWDLIAAREPRLPEFENKVATVFCNDCNKRSEIPHALWLRKCGWCDSYNTALISVADRPPQQSGPIAQN